MKRSFVLVMVFVAAAGLLAAGCGSKKATTGGPAAAPEAVRVGTVDNSPMKWTYDAQPTPSFIGTPNERLTSFGFDEGAAIMRSEGMGACREAVKKLTDPAAATFLLVGFADGIKETNKAETLGMQRAEAAKRFLGTLGIKPEQMQLTSFGSRYSIAKDFEKIKLGFERKVEIWLMQ